ncbi:HAD-IIIA family hydrolase [Paenibacillus cremeus]|uniref:D,D-heptose 1,7-bisphosphate phosphatase n=1 Tax=Paenibacillus cremeus TaxID=2163881 RepID=A0A559KH99_9BACL|nr:HAD-IIIA family hydrolase [Paenibacillus cremeus]TVY11458.1 HAD-IIIA family hydrolase [Paenibacillus cremeus]
MKLLRDIQAVFIDRDGTIGGTGHFVHPREFAPYEKSIEAIAMLKASGLKVFAFTNQHRIARGEATVEQFQAQFAEYGFDGAYVCPHAPSEGCACHKPAPGLLHQAAEEHGLELGRCVVIGDVGSTDMLAAAAVGASKVLVRTGWGQGSLGAYRHTWAQTEPEYVADDLWAAAQWITARVCNE